MLRFAHAAPGLCLQYSQHHAPNQDDTGREARPVPAEFPAGRGIRRHHARLGPEDRLGLPIGILPRRTFWSDRHHVSEVAERLKLNHETARRLFMNEPGVVVICNPKKGRRVYRTLRIPVAVYDRVVTRLTRVGCV